MIFIISYDLQKPTQRYNELIAAIRNYSNWACIGGSAYLIETNESHVEVRDKLGKFLDGNDMLFVANVNAPAAWQGYDNEVSQWILSKLK
ncbi:MAG: hypothetical protein J6A35_03230 [Paludibacteraceae bacterium]|nr:hypothetical protein [Paludibacteraceae bacterium]